MNTLKALFAVAALMAMSTVHAQEAPRQDVYTGADCGRQWCTPYWKSMPKLEYVYWAAEAADCSTTLDIKNHKNLQEENPILGHHPSDGMIIGACVSTALIHSAITYVLIDDGVPPKVVKIWEYVSIGVESAFAAHNYSLGLRFKF